MQLNNYFSIFLIFQNRRITPEAIHIKPKKLESLVKVNNMISFNQYFLVLNEILVS